MDGFSDEARNAELLTARVRTDAGMRVALRLLVAVGLLPLLLAGSAAFNAGTTGGRGVTVNIVGDSAAYLAVLPNGDSPHACFVTEQSSPASESGKIKIDFGSAAGCAAGGAGTGVNAGDSASKRVRYAFHDLLLITNKGTRTILVWVNATTSPPDSGQAIHVAKNTLANQMTDSDTLYKASNPDSVSLAVGASAYVGVRIKTGTVSSGSITGTVEIDARGN